MCLSLLFWVWIFLCAAQQNAQINIYYNEGRSSFLILILWKQRERRDNFFPYQAKHTNYRSNNIYYMSRIIFKRWLLSIKACSCYLNELKWLIADSGWTETWTKLMDLFIIIMPNYFIAVKDFKKVLNFCNWPFLTKCFYCKIGLKPTTFIWKLEVSPILWLLLSLVWQLTERIQTGRLIIFIVGKGSVATQKVSKWLLLKDHNMWFQGTFPKLSFFLN